MRFSLCVEQCVRLVVSLHPGVQAPYLVARGLGQHLPARGRAAGGGGGVARSSRAGAGQGRAGQGELRSTGTFLQQAGRGRRCHRFQVSRRRPRLSAAARHAQRHPDAGPHALSTHLASSGSLVITTGMAPSQISHTGPYCCDHRSAEPSWPCGWDGSQQTPGGRACWWERTHAGECMRRATARCGGAAGGRVGGLCRRRQRRGAPRMPPPGVQANGQSAYHDVHVQQVAQEPLGFGAWRQGRHDGARKGWVAPPPADAHNGAARKAGKRASRSPLTPSTPNCLDQLEPLQPSPLPQALHPQQTRDVAVAPA